MKFVDMGEKLSYKFEFAFTNLFRMELGRIMCMFITVIEEKLGVKDQLVMFFACCGNNSQFFYLCNGMPQA